MSYATGTLVRQNAKYGWVAPFLDDGLTCPYRTKDEQILKSKIDMFGTHWKSM